MNKHAEAPEMKRTRKANRKTSQFMQKTLFVTAAIAMATLAMPAILIAGDRTIKFVNNTGDDVDDLHIETKQGVTIESKDPFTGERGVNGGNKHNLHGGTVANGASATVKMSSTSPEIMVKQWWWTLGGTALKDGNRVGDVHKTDDGGTELSFHGGRSAGDGQVLVSINNDLRIFNAPPGMPPDAVAMMFNQFVDQFFDVTYLIDSIHNFMPDPNSVMMLGNIVGDPTIGLQIQITIPDSNQEWTQHPVDRGPELSTTGRCPGRMSLVVDGATPFGPVEFYYGFGEGGTQVPGCPGVILSLNQAVLLGVIPANGAGHAVLSGNAPRAACRTVMVQALDRSSCLLTNLKGLR